MNPAPIARINTARDRHETDRCKQTISATMSPTGRNARVKNIPNAITVPEANAMRMPANAGQPGRSGDRAAQAASARADVESKG